jgi:pathogenesis-related protein 1
MYKVKINLSYIRLLSITLLLINFINFTNADDYDYVYKHNVIRSEVFDINKYWFSLNKNLKKQAQDWANYLANNYWKNNIWQSPHTDYFNKWKHNFTTNCQWENIAWWSPWMDIYTAINLWNEEKKYYSYVNNSCSWNCGHYTQIIWQNSREIWCASSKSKLWYWEWVVCRYSPAWNYIWEKPYIKDNDYITYSSLDKKTTSANFLASKDIINNHINDTENYYLWKTITRREMLKIMMKIEWSTIIDKCNWKFTDLSSSDWWCKYAELALKKWMIAANASFRPNDSVSKIEALKMIMKAKWIERYNLSDWKEGYIKAALDNKIISVIFDDYSTKALRWWIFVTASNTF